MGCPVDGAVDVGYATGKVLVIRQAIYILRRGFQYGEGVDY